METPPLNTGGIEAQVIDTLHTCFDPEIPLTIDELGLTYDARGDPSGAVAVQMPLTSPNCPAMEQLPREVETKVRAVPGVTGATVDVIWDPPWGPSRMPDAARLQLGLM